MAEIHPMAIVEDGATLGEGVRIGPFCCVGSRVTLGPDVVLESHVVVTGRTTIGQATHVYPFASIGTAPQDLKYAGEDSEIVIGARNVIREQVTINPGTAGGGMITRVGDDCLLMIASHVAHDCLIGNSVIMANNSALAGHVTLQDHVIIGGLSAVHQFVRIGCHAMIGGVTGIGKDVIPYASATGNRAVLAGLNFIGLKRRGFDQATVRAIRTAYHMLFAPEGTLETRLDAIATRFADNAAVMKIVDFVREDATRPLCQPSAHRER